jgi:hypothetical protein
LETRIRGRCIEDEKDTGGNWVFSWYFDFVTSKTTFWEKTKCVH